RLNILITGNLGYVGPVLVNHLREVWPDSFLAGYDLGYFAAVNTGIMDFADTKLNLQYYGDVRTADPSVFEGIDAVVHLAAISNDPIGNKFEKITHEVNHEASVRAASLAKKAGVKKFVFASS